PTIAYIDTNPKSHTVSISLTNISDHPLFLIWFYPIVVLAALMAARSLKDFCQHNNCYDANKYCCCTSRHCTSNDASEIKNQIRKYTDHHRSFRGTRRYSFLTVDSV